MGGGSAPVMGFAKVQITVNDCGHAYNVRVVSCRLPAPPEPGAGRPTGHGTPPCRGGLKKPPLPSAPSLPRPNGAPGTGSGLGWNQEGRARRRDAAPFGSSHPHGGRLMAYASRRTRLSRYAEDRCGLNALVRLRLAFKVPRPGGRVAYWLTPRGAALLRPHSHAPLPCGTNPRLHRVYAGARDGCCPQPSGVLLPCGRTATLLRASWRFMGGARTPVPVLAFSKNRGVARQGMTT